MNINYFGNGSNTCPKCHNQTELCCCDNYTATIKEINFNYINMSELTHTVEKYYNKTKSNKIIEVLKLYFPNKQTDCYYELAADKIMEVMEDK